MKKIKKIVAFLILAIVFTQGTKGVLAAVELRYVNARQAYVDTFYNKTVAQLIFEESAQHDVNARLILVMLQRESSSITQSTPSSTTRGAWPLFYNYDERMADCLNGVESSCNDSKYTKADYSYRAENYGGVGQQIAYATAQLRNLVGDANPANGTYCDGSLVVSVDGQNITTDNAESCALYKYTPHAVSYDTSSAFYTNWVDYWQIGTPNGGDYSATNIISTNNFRNLTPLTVDEINNFLISKGSWLANYTIPEYISVPYPAIAAPPPPPTPVSQRLIPGDTNEDQHVNSVDLSVLAGTWGQNVAANTGADFSGDGLVDSTDLSILAAYWGR